MAKTGSIRSHELFGRDHWDALPVIAEDAIYPRDAEHRYRLLERFREQRESAVRVGECLLWGATLPQPNGYAAVRIRRVGREYAHRLSWEDAFGPIPVGGHVLHRCDTPLCIEPRHLFLGDQRSNTADMRAKGRDDTSGLQRRGEWTHCKRGHLLAGENLIVHKIQEDDLYPRDQAHRFRVYARRGDEIEVLACAGSPAALGVALVQLDEDERDRGRRLVDLGAIGVLDAVAGRWLILPWQRPEIPMTVGPSPEELLARLYAAGWRIADDGDPYRPDEVPEGR